MTIAVSTPAGRGVAEVRGRTALVSVTPLVKAQAG
jgi:hypothetical protein